MCPSNGSRIKLHTREGSPSNSAHKILNKVQGKHTYVGDIIMPKKYLRCGGVRDGLSKPSHAGPREY